MKTTRTHSKRGPNSWPIAWVEHSGKPQGVALVATLIMLSLVTFMTVAFLGVARRERRSMEAHINQGDAHAAMDAALNMAQAELVGRLLSVDGFGTSDPWGYSLFVSTNYINPAIFSPSSSSVTNVNDHQAMALFRSGAAGTADAWLRNLANLRFLPRVPVYDVAYTNGDVGTYGGESVEERFGRFFVDFNRNGLFEPTFQRFPDGTLIGETNWLGIPTSFNSLVGNFVGDPHWIGILEDPNQRHSGSNRFVGRYAFVVTPAGKSIDLNHSHNQNKIGNSGRLASYYGYSSSRVDGFIRNQGVGSWEQNLAGLLVELNTNWWVYGAYSSSLPDPAAFGGQPSIAFHHALGMLQYRWNQNFSNLTNIFGMYDEFPSTRMTAGGADYVGDSVNTDVDTLLRFHPPHVNISATNPLTGWNYSWAGATNSSARDSYRYHSVNDLWNSDPLLASNFTANLRLLSTANSNYSVMNNTLQAIATSDHYTWYRLLENLETESRPRETKVNLNWDNLNSYITGGNIDWDAQYGFPDSVNRVYTNAGTSQATESFINWSALRFFTNVSQALLDSSVITNVQFMDTNATPLGQWALLTNYSIGGPAFDVGDSRIYGTNIFTQISSGHTRTNQGGTWYQVPENPIPFAQTNGGLEYATNIATKLAMTNITVFPVNQFTPEVQRLLQVAANLYETAGNGREWDPAVNYVANSQVRRDGMYYRNSAAISGVEPPAAPWVFDGPGLPAVFRPIFRYNTNSGLFGTPLNSIYISEWVEAGDPSWVTGVTYLDLNEADDRLTLLDATVNNTVYDYMVKGFPVIIGAKAGTFDTDGTDVSGGLPNFNEVSYSLMAEVTRKLQFVKTNYGALRPSLTNQMFIVGLKGGLGLEAWNPYHYSYPRELDLYASNYMTVTIENEVGPIYTNRITNGIVWNVPQGSWPTALPLTNGNAFVTPFGEYFNILSNAAYYPSIYTNLVTGLSTNGGFRVVNSRITPSAVFVATNLFPDIELKIRFSNWVTYAAVDRYYNRLVDYVNLGDITGTIDLVDMLLGSAKSTSSTTTSPQAAAIVGGVTPFYSTNRYAYSNGIGWYRSTNLNHITEGVRNQINVSAGRDYVIWGNTNYAIQANNLWTEYNPSVQNIAARREFFKAYMGLPSTARPYLGTNPVDAPFSPTIMAKMDLRFEANDPLVHHSEYQLVNERSGQDTNFAVLSGYDMARISASRPEDLPFLIGLPGTVGRVNDAFRPWGGHPLGNTEQAGSANRLRNFNLAIKDPGVYEPRQWHFPERRFGSLGWLGRVHRGTPWQTVYLKSRVAYPTNWYAWSGAFGTHPTNDWRLFDNLSVAVNQAAASGALSVNQTNRAGWAAVLSGLNVVSNSSYSAGALLPTLSSWSITPGSWQFRDIHGGIDLQRRLQTSFVRHGDILSVPELSDASPYVDYGVGRYDATASYIRGQNVVHRGIVYYAFNPVSGITPPALRDHLLPVYDINTAYAEGTYVRHSGQLWYATTDIAVAESPDNSGNWYHGWEVRRTDMTLAEAYGFTDNVLEKIPQSILSLVKLEPHPRVAVYAFGQSLAPAANSVYLFPGVYQNMVTNYQVIGETAARMVLRVEGIPEPHLLPYSTNLAPAVYPRVVVEDFKILSDQ